MGKNIQSTVPTFPAHSKPQLLDVEKLRQREHESRLQQQVNFNKRHRAAPLGTLSPGTKVHITSHDRESRALEKTNMFHYMQKAWNQRGISVES